MRKITLLLMIVGITFPLFSNAPFTSGNVMVLQAGDGIAALSAAAINLKEYNTTTAAPIFAN